MSNPDNNLVTFNDFILDTKEKTLKYLDEDVDLPLKAIELLCVLIGREGELVTKEQILDMVWKDSFVEESVLTQNIYRLRKVFKSHGIEEELIKNVPRRGYRFLGEIAFLVEEEVSIERTRVERRVVAGFEDDGISDRESFPQDSRSFFRKKVLVLSVLLLILSFLTIGGAGVWFWSSESDKQQARLTLGNLALEPLTSSGNAFVPAISGDNQHLAYVRNTSDKYSIVLKNLSTGSETLVVEDKPFELRSIVFSTDGKYLYYGTREPNLPESTIYRVPTYGGTEEKLVSNVRHEFSLSPYGNQFSYFRYDAKKDRTHLVVSEVDGSNERIVATKESPEFFQVWERAPAWSPDAKKLVVSGYGDKVSAKGKSRNSYLLEVEIENGKEKRLSHPAWSQVGQSYWLNDGSALVVSVYEDLENFSQLWLLSYPTGLAKKITNDTNHYAEFRLSADTRSIIATNRTEYSNLFLVSLDQPKDVRSVTTETIGHFGMWGIDWTRDGKELVYVKSKGRNDGNLWLLNVETKKRRQLTFDSSKVDRSPKVTPDGKSVLFSSNRNGKRQIWRVDLDGTNLIQITNSTGGAESPEISSDGEWLFYAVRSSEQTTLWKRPYPGGEEIQVLDNASVSKTSPSNDGNILLFHFDKNERVGSPWKFILYSHSEKRKLKHLTINAHNKAIEWNKEGNGIFFAERTMSQNNLMLHTVEDDKSKQITNFTDQKITNLDVSPDGNTVALSRGNLTSNIYRISGIGTVLD